MAIPPTAILSSTQLATLAAHGEERTAEVGDILYRVGDLRYPFIAVLEGEAAILDASGHEIIRHGASGFLGELNLLSGQTVFVTAVATKPMRYIAVDRDELRAAAVRRRRVLGPAVVELHRAARGTPAGKRRAWRSSGHTRRSRRGGCSSSPGATACPTFGVIPSATTILMRRR